MGCLGFWQTRLSTLKITVDLIEQPSVTQAEIVLRLSGPVTGWLTKHSELVQNLLKQQERASPELKLIWR